jgi:ankyrin repeat protein
MGKLEGFSLEEVCKARKPKPNPSPLGTSPEAPPSKNKAVSYDSGQVQILPATMSPESAKAVDKDDRTPLYSTARAGLVDINKGANVKAIDKDGQTALHDATRAGSEDTIR